MRGVINDLPSVVGFINGTSHRIYKPGIDQASFYSGHRKAHVIHTQIIVDVRFKIRYIHD